MDDVARQLPDPPPPRPAARSAAIAAAVARFDGGAALAPAAVPVPRAPRWRIARGPVGLLASVLLVAVIGIPIALLHPNEHALAPTSRDVAPSAAFDAAPPSRPAGDSSMAQGESVPLGASLPKPQSRASAAAAPHETNVASANLSAPSSAPPAVMAPLPPPTPSPPIAKFSSSEGKAAVPAPAESAVMADRAREDIVVTGARRSQSGATSARRGDWNACTVDDPERTLRSCQRLLRIGAKGSAGDVADHLANGLTQAWQGDADAAIAAFDAAIALQPKLGVAHLNRGLALWHAGAIARAAADLDLAIRYDPAARSYYARARFRSDRGDWRGAQADEARAIEIDPRYADLIAN